MRLVGPVLREEYTLGFWRNDFFHGAIRWEGMAFLGWVGLGLVFDFLAEEDRHYVKRIGRMGKDGW